MTKPEEILQSAREKKGYTQESLAKELKMTTRTIQRYEGGEWPKYKNEKIVAIDNLLGTNLCEVIYDKPRRGESWIPDSDKFLVSKAIKHDAILETILELLVEQESARTKQPVTKLLRELNKTVLDKEASMLDRLKQGGGK